MRELLFLPGAIVYFLVIGLLFAFAINYLYLTFTAINARNIGAFPLPMEEWPRVTIQLPIYNERYVAERLIRASAAMNYPRERLEIQVLDDSTDDTMLIIQQAVEAFRSQGIQIEHIHRRVRTGFKAGALANGHKLSKGDFLAIFDADFIPAPDFLRNALPYFSDPKVGFVQARWEHANRNYSLLTIVQALMLDGHFAIEQYARSQMGAWFNFNGTAGVWRRETIEQAGGWKAETLTEDLDLSYRSFLAGWQARFLRHLSVPAELPVSFNAYRTQQHRWARGSLECAAKFLPAIWRSGLPLLIKFQATFHLTGNLVYMLLLLLSLIYPLALYISQYHAGLDGIYGIGAFLNLTAFAPTLFFGVAQHQLGRRWFTILPALLFTSIFSAGMMLNTSRAVWQAFWKKKNDFERTPKFGITKRDQDWTTRRYQLKLDRIVFAELAFAALNLYTVSYALSMENWIIAGYSLLLAIGLLFTSGLTIYQSILLAIPGHKKAE